MAVDVWEKVLKGVMFAVHDSPEPAVVGVLGELISTVISRAIQAESGSSADECFVALSIRGRGKLRQAGEAYIDQFGHHYCSL